MFEVFIAVEIAILEVELLYGVLAVRAVIYQPQYFPRLHYFARILNANVFVIADNVQFVRKHAYHKPDGSNPIGPSYQAHTLIKSSKGPLTLDFPTKKEGRKSIAETQVVYNAQCDAGKHMRLFFEHYRKAPYFKEVYPTLESLFAECPQTVGGLNDASIRWGLGYLLELSPHEVFEQLPCHGFRLSRVCKSSESGVPLSDKTSGRDANDWLVDLCKTYNADEYYFGGTGASAYMDFSKFEKAGIALKEQEWTLSPYPQLHGDFIPNLSIIDLLMNVTPREARAILASTD